MLFRKVSCVKLVELDRNIFFFLHIQFYHNLLPTCAVNFESCIEISWFIKADDCILEMSKNILFFDLNLTPSRLFVIVKYVWAVRTDDSILIWLFFYSLQIEYLPIFQIFKSGSSYKRNPIILWIGCQNFIYEASIICLELITICRYSCYLFKSIFRWETFGPFIRSDLLAPCFFDD